MTSNTKRMPNPIDEQVGSRLRARRMALGRSQTNRAEAIGVTFQQIQKYEKGTNRIGTRRLYQLAAMLNVNPGFFFEHEIGKPRPSSSADVLTEFLATPEGAALMNAFRKVPSATVRRRLLALVQKLADLEN